MSQNVEVYGSLFLIQNGI